MKIFRFLRHHKANLALALALLMVQAYCELTLPSVMSEIVDTGISRGGIEDVVPNRITSDDLGDVELLLTPGEVNRVEALYSSPAYSKGIFGTVMRSRAFWERPR